jgi:hypothetical protein
LFGGVFSTEAPLEGFFTMKTKRPLLTDLGLLLLLGSVQSPIASPRPDKAHTLALAAPHIEAQTCSGVSTMEDCLRLFPADCTRSAQYDAYLSFLKNQRPSALAHPNGVLTPEDFDQKESDLPSSMTSRNHADHANELADLGEGNNLAFAYIEPDHRMELYELGFGPSERAAKLQEGDGANDKMD